MATASKQVQKTQKLRAKPVRKYRCPECDSLTVIHQGGCSRCLDCGWNACIEG